MKFTELKLSEIKFEIVLVITAVVITTAIFTSVVTYRNYETIKKIEEHHDKRVIAINNINRKIMLTLERLKKKRERLK